MGNIAKLWIVIAVAAFMFHVMISAEIADSEDDNKLEPSNSSFIEEDSGEPLQANQNDNNELLLANIELQKRVTALENRLENVEALLTSLNNDAQFYHPTSEVQFVDMEVVHWDQALKNGLRNVAIPFEAGYVTGAISSWEFSLASENDSVTVNLLLIEERYNRRAIFAGFTAYVLNDEGNVYSQANALPVNFLDGSGRTLHLPNVISLSEIRNSSNGLLTDDDVYKMRFRLELIGVGHKLYSENPAHPHLPGKDVQTVIFDVANLFQKLEERTQGGNNSLASSVSSEQQPLAFTKFTLKHDAWYMDTDWSAEIFDGDNGESVSFHVILERCDWPKLYASFYMEVWDVQNKRLIHKQAMPVNNFVKDRITIDPLFVVSQLEEDYSDELPTALQFKLQFVVYGRNARYYSDVI